MNEGDYEKGKRVSLKTFQMLEVKGRPQIFKLRCSHCHVIDTTAPKMGPSLNGIMGRTSGTMPGYKYSEANKNKVGSITLDFRAANI